MSGCYIKMNQLYQLQLMKNSQLNSSLPNEDPEMSSKRTKNKIPIYLNIYNFNPTFNRCCSCFGLGVYHTGIELYGQEYIYYGFEGDQTGVGYLEPRSAAYEFKEQMLMGHTDYSLYQIDEHIIEPLSLQFTGRQKSTYKQAYNIGNRYDLLNFNCNHFSKRFAEMLQVEVAVPSYIFTITDFFNKCRCCIPNCILNGRLDWFNKKEEDQESLAASMHIHFKQQQSL